MKPPSFARAALAVATLVVCLGAAVAARAEALLVVEVDSGKVLQADNATSPWYPASVTKLMTTYVTLQRVKEGRLSLDSLITVSPVAAAQAPSKMGFRSGTQVTVDNALKMMMVKSANDMAVVLAEGVSGSVEAFAADMNATAERLGMSQTHYVNPNGLPDDGQVTSARDLAILARAIIRDLPEYEYFVHIPAIRFGRRVTPNFNRLIGRYPGADGMKTGFICASGFNLVASATRDGKRLIAVVLGAQSSQMRAVRAMQLLDKGFSNTSLTWLAPSLGTVDMLRPIEAAPPNLRDAMCGPKRKRPASETEDEQIVANAAPNAASFFTAALQSPTLKPSDYLAMAAAPAEPVIVYTGPKKSGTALIAAVAVETAKQTPAPKPKRAKRATVQHAAAKPTDAKLTDSKLTIMVDPSPKPAVKPAVAVRPTAVARPASAKPVAVAKPVPAKPAGTTPLATVSAPAKPTAKPVAAKPAASAKPVAAAKPKPGETKPADKPKAVAQPRDESPPG